MKRVVITGLGTFSSSGSNTKELFENLSLGESGVKNIKCLIDSDLKTKIGGKIDEEHINSKVSAKDKKKYDAFSLYALIAAKEAWKDANLQKENVNSEKLGVSIANSIGGIGTLLEEAYKSINRGIKKVSPRLIPAIMPNAASAIISINWDAKGGASTPVSACAGSNEAITLAYNTIQKGENDIMFAGGTEAALNNVAISSFSNAKALSQDSNPQKASKPFDKNRDGFVMSEGAGVLILESLDHALERDANIYAEIIGTGSSSDSYHLVSPEPKGEGAALAMRKSLDSAGISAQQVDIVSAHATSTPAGDVAEAQAIKTIFDQVKPNIPVTANKSMTGHMLGASGAIEAIALVLSLKKGVILPTINLETIDSECDLNIISKLHKVNDLNIGLSNSFGFGGHNSSLIIKRW
ncbi:beta-ketoacyl-[acyl-carrier-protein] synthase family protein [Staphylococcus succinus]|uniref:beta-ketoacyl-[acyl-carrier-protein] synthase family protein n=1 Tax=Staphylococcus succinus TaxID=61015 RepID=UPI003F5BFD0D